MINQRRGGGVQGTLAFGVGTLSAGTLRLGLLALLLVAGCADVRRDVRDRVDTTVDAISRTATPTGPRDTATIRREPDLRVRIMRQADRQQLAGPERFVVRAASGTATSPAQKARTLAGPLTISSGERGVRTIDGHGVQVDWGFGVDLDILASDGTIDGAAEAPSESLRLGSRLIPGFLTIRPSWSEHAARFDVIATMPVESYLPGVLGKELIRTWPRQAFEAQAVAARTYALQERSRARTEGRLIDVEDTTSDQVFEGTSSLMVAVEATRATRGWALTDDGSCIRAYFSSQCGGRPASAARAWTTGSPLPFNRAGALQGKPRQAYCQRSPLHRWTIERSADDLQKRLRAWGRSKGRDLMGLTRIRSIEVRDRNEAGRPDAYSIVTDTGREYAMSPEELREAANWSVPGLDPITRENRFSSGDVDVIIRADSVRVIGRGFGHGVGMCQWCAKGMAEAGLDWRSMIDQFYPGVDVRKLY